MNRILDKLDIYTKEWAKTLTEDDIAHLLQGIYKLPGLLETLKNLHPIIYLPQNEESKSKIIADLTEFDSQPCSKNLPNQEFKTKSIPLLPKTKSSTQLGQIGEDIFREACQKLPSEYTVEDMTKVGKMADFIVTYEKYSQHIKCLVDIKNYSRNVPKSEIDKFRNDLQFSHCNMGMIISLNSKFAGISDMCYCETSPQNIMFIRTSEPAIIRTAIMLYVRNQTTSNTCVNVTKLRCAIDTINHNMVSSAQTRRLFLESGQTLVRTLQKCNDILLENEIRMEQYIEKLQNSLEPISENETTDEEIPDQYEPLVPETMSAIQILSALKELKWDKIFEGKSKVIFTKNSIKIIISSSQNNATIKEGANVTEIPVDETLLDYCNKLFE